MGTWVRRKQGPGRRDSNADRAGMGTCDAEENWSGEGNRVGILIRMEPGWEPGCGGNKVRGTGF